MKVTRRQFLTTSAVIGGTMAVGGWKTVLHGLGPAGDVPALAPAAGEQIFRSANNPECNHCAFQVHVRNGKVVRLSPDPNFYLRPCLRGYARLQLTYHPDRIKYPMKRVGERGEGKWQRISWDEALDTIAQKLAAIRDQYGPEAVLFQGGAVLSVMPGAIRGRFANAFGKGVTTGTVGNLCCGAQGEASSAVLGYRASWIENIGDAKLMIAWGHNPAVTYIPHWRYIAQGIDNGMRLITIDPRYSETATKSDLWISIKPGTDTVLALGMIKVILDEKLYDGPFALKRTNLPFLVNTKTGKLVREADVKAGGDAKAFQVWDKATNAPAKPDVATQPVLEGTFDIAGTQVKTVFLRLKERVAKYTPAKVEEMTGVPGQQAVDLARLYATTKPAMINSAMSGAQRTTNGTYLMASLIYLSALTGNMGVKGGGVNDTAGASVGTNQSFTAPFPAKTKGNVTAARMGVDLLANKPYPIKAVYFGGGGPGQKPDSTKYREALMKMDFLVTQDSLLTDAAQISDIVLPVAQLFEKSDIIVSSRNFYYQLMDKAIEPMWESKPDSWIFTELAKRLGFGEYFNKTDEEWINYVLQPTGLTVDSLRKTGPVWAWSDPKLNRFKVKWDKPPFYWYKDTPFETPSGRVEFHSVRWEQAGFDPMADYTYPPGESPETTPDLAKKYPLMSTNAKLRRSVHSMFGMTPWMTEIFPEAWVDIHEDDAAARGIKDGDTVEVLNDRGTIQVKAHVHVGIRPGVISLQNGWWMQQGGNASVLSNNAPEPMVSAHTLNSTLVQVRKNGGNNNV